MASLLDFHGVPDRGCTENFRCNMPVSSINDVVVWEHAKSGIFTVKSAYFQIVWALFKVFIGPIRLILLCKTLLWIFVSSINSIQLR